MVSYQRFSEELATNLQVQSYAAWPGVQDPDMYGTSVLVCLPNDASTFFVEGLCAVLIHTFVLMTQ